MKALAIGQRIAIYYLELSESSAVVQTNRCEDAWSIAEVLQGELFQSWTAN